MYSRRETRDQDFALLLRSRYGAPRTLEPRPPVRRSVQFTVDSGEEVLERPLEPPEDEYVVDRPEPPAELTPQAPDTHPALLVPPPLDAPAAPTAPTVPTAPLVAPAPDQVSSSTQSPPAPAEPVPPSSPSAGPASPSNGGLPSVPPPPPAAEPPARGASGLTDADLAADMQAILGGGMVYDQSVGRVRPRNQDDPAPGGGAPESAAATATERPLPDAPDEQSIFDRIARSMEHANSFDLGTHELHQTFAALERADQARRTPLRPAPPEASASRFTAPSSAPALPLTPSPVAGLRPEDFAAAYERDTAGRSSGCAGGSASSAALALHGDGTHSVPMYDTGEHVRSGGDLFPDQLIVGAGSGVPFSYGQIIAMPDFYATVDDLVRADPAELQRLKALIVRNTAYYAGGMTDPSGRVSNEEWDRATGDRYMRLAEANYDHFAPAPLLGLPGPQTQYDHKRRWHELHRRALQEKGELVLAHPNASLLAVGPLTVNAFADHFLTDAFAAGHLVNKEVLMDRFRSRFFSGSTLTADGARFFDQVAQAAWTAAVRNAMGRLEPTSPPDALCTHGLCLPITPNIRTAGMFAEVLKQAATGQPDKIANLAVKVLHDKLNRDGVDVVNDAGDGWRLTGDGHLTPATLAIMRRAVDQSVANLDDPSVLTSDPSHDPLLARVWRYTPRPTPASRVVLTRAVDTYSDPRSADFVAATATLIIDQINVLVRALVASGRMREGGGI